MIGASEANSGARPAMTRRTVFSFYALSGFIALGYQVVWFRVFADRFGSSHLTFTLVVANFILGLGVGSLLSQPVTDRVQRILRLRGPLMAYGAIELAVAVAAALTLMGSWTGAGGFAYIAAGDGVWRPTGVHQLAKAGSAWLTVFLPCFFMGLTYPLLCSVFREDTRFPSRLYGWNTLGACAAVLAMEFALLPMLGHNRAFLLLLGLNLGVSFYFLFARLDRPGPGPVREAKEAPRLDSIDGAAKGGLESMSIVRWEWICGTLPGFKLFADKLPGEPRYARLPWADGWEPFRVLVKWRKSLKPPSTGGQGRTGGGLAADAIHPGTALACAAVGGALAGALEADMFMRVRFIGHRYAIAMSFVSFWAILAIFAASWASRAAGLRRLKPIKLALAGALAVYLVTWRLIYPLRDWFQGIHFGAIARIPPGGAAIEAALAGVGMASMMASIGVVVFPAYFLVSLLLPHVCDRMQGQGRHLGVVYGVNTAAFCLGMIGFARLAPTVNIFYSMKLFFAFFVAAVAAISLLNDARPPRPGLLGLCAAGFLAACLIAPKRFDRRFFPPSEPPAVYPAIALKSDGVVTTYVLDRIGARQLYFDSHPMSADSEGAQRYMRLMAHFPLLAHPQPRSALLICFGVGNTASAIAMHETIERVDVVDMNRRVFETAPIFAATNFNVREDPRFRWICDDGRSFLKFAEGTYDLITSEPPPPLYEGVYRLYSKEYYAEALAKLSEAGLMTQWLPLDQLTREAKDRIVATFVQAFPHCLLFDGNERQLILMGGRRPIDLATAARRFGAAGAAGKDMRRFGTERAAQLLGRIVLDDEALRREYGGKPIISDQGPDLSRLQFSRRAPTIEFDPARTLALGAAAAPEAEPELRRMAANIAEWHEAIPDMPFGSLLRARSSGPIAGAEADWEAIAEVNRRGSEARKQGRPAEALDIYLKSLAAAEQPAVLEEVAAIYAELGEEAAAENVKARLRELGRDPAAAPAPAPK